MVFIVKSEWHQVEKRYGVELDLELLQDIYPDKEEEELMQLHSDILAGNASIDDVIADATDSGVDIDWWWLDEDDWITDRKGGYEVTYSVDN